MDAEQAQNRIRHTLFTKLIESAITHEQLRELHNRMGGYSPKEAIQLNKAMRKRWEEIKNGLNDDSTC